jgi:hypothetical protein
MARVRECLEHAFGYAVDKTHGRTVVRFPE